MIAPMSQGAAPDCPPGPDASDPILLRASLPIVPHMTASLDLGERAGLDRMADRLLKDDPLLNATAPFGPGVASGLGPWPALVLEDHSAITLFERGGDKAYSYRALLLAQDGDMVAIGARRSPGFERYCRECLRLGRVEVLKPYGSAARDALAIRCAKDAEFIGSAARLARDHGGLNVIPYMGTGGAWRLAGEIARTSRMPVRVAAPPPRLTRCVNDKLWFSEQVTQVLGGTRRPATFAAFSMAGLTGRVAKLAREQAAVAVKLTDSASSAGNIVLDSKALSGLSLKSLRRVLITALKRAKWRGQFPLIVTDWEQPILASPSVQLWIGEPGREGVIVEGIFDQMILGEARTFSGAKPTVVSANWRKRIADQAGRLGYLFGALGYYGRCSFDAILVGESEDAATLHWIECNGRWGGTSLPMTLANRLVGDWYHHPFVVIERDDLRGTAGSVDGFLEQHHDLLFDLDDQAVGMVLLSPGQIETGQGFELMVIGASLQQAQSDAERISRRLLHEANEAD